MEGPAYTRTVDRMVLYGESVDATPLLEALVTAKTRYLVFDLDRTIHKGRNLGELLGWELGAFLCYGDDYLAKIESTRGPGRMLLRPDRPLAMARYVFDGARRWAYPGLLYLFYVKWGYRFDWSTRQLYRRFGPSPVGAVQDVTRTALLHHLTELPLETLRLLATRLWRRYQSDLVFTREDLDGIRRRHPTLKIILSSASPLPVLEVAKEELGADAILCSSVAVEQDFLCSPPELDWRFLLGSPRNRISLPGSFRHNAGPAKVESLLERFPDFCDEDVETVGISDTGYGEDHDWLNHFTKVADVNSTAPFPPLVSMTSPLREIHSAGVRTISERGKSTGPPSATGEPARQLTSAQLEARVAQHRRRVDSLSRIRDEKLAALSVPLEAHRAAMSRLKLRVERAVVAHNESTTSRQRREALRELNGLSRTIRSERKRLARSLRGVADLQRQIDETLSAARASLEP